MPADYSQGPGSAYIEALLKTQGYWPTDPNKQALARLQADIAANAAIEKWETLVSWGPFMAGSEPETRDFEATDYDGILGLQGAIVELQDVKIHGRAVALNQVRQIKTQIGGSTTRAVTDLRLGYVVGGGTGSSYGYGDWYSGSSNVAPIEVTAIWGVTYTFPADIWSEILQEAGTNLLSRIENLQSISNLSQGGFSKGLDVVGIISQKDLFSAAKTFQDYAKAWRRPTL